MIGWVYVMEQRDFDNWLSGNVSGQTPVEAGRDLFETKLGCASCHQQTDGGRGPKMAGVFGKDVKLTNGQTVKADDNYIRESILNPGGQIVEGYQPIMPTFKGQVTEDQLNSLVAYIKSLGTGTAAPASGTQPAASPAKPAAPANTAANTSAPAKATEANKGGK
jgi:cytochrome c oxidase subunit II